MGGHPLIELVLFSGGKAFDPFKANPVVCVFVASERAC